MRNPLTNNHRLVGPNVRIKPTNKKKPNESWLNNGYMWFSGWWYTYPSEKYDFVSWDDEIPNTYYMESHKIHVPNHQLVMYSPHFSF